MHLLSLLSPLAPDLVVAYPPLLPARLAQLLEEREIEIVPVPDEEFETMGPNVLALAPRVALAVEGNPETRRRLEQGRSRGRGLRGQGALERRRRPDLPHQSAPTSLSPSSK